VADITDERIAKAVRDGEDAFWAAVAEQFPEAESGDLAPDAAFALKRAMKMAVRAWVDANVTSRDSDDLGVEG
jgi:arginyl-tRNA synthetase